MWFYFPERALEDHEVISDVIKLWPSKKPPTLLLRIFAPKNKLWMKNFIVSKHLKESFFIKGATFSVDF